MKKIIALLSCIMIMIFCVGLTGCGESEGQYSDSKYVGKWTATQVEINGETNPIGDYLDSEFSITLHADGSASIVNKGESNVGVWEPTNDGFSIDAGTNEFIEDGETVVLEFGGLKFIFEQ